MTTSLDVTTLYKIWGPKTVQIELVNLCNAKCLMCDRWKWAKENRELIGTLNTLQLVALFDELKSLGTKTILFTGGEPTLYKDFALLLEQLPERNMTPAMFTTGIAVNANLAQKLINSNARVVFSVDGATKETYQKIRGVNAFEILIKNIANLVEEREKVKNNQSVIGINSTIQRDNAHEILKLFELAKKLKVDFIRFGLVHGETNTSIGDSNVSEIVDSWERLKNQTEKTNLKVFMSPFLSEIAEKKIIRPDVKKGLPTKQLFERKKVNCFKVHEYSLIDAFGKVYPCTYAYFDNQPFSEFNDRRNDYCLGDINEKSFTEIWKGDVYNQFRKKVNPVSVQQTANACGQCEHFFEFNETQDLLATVFEKTNEHVVKEALEKMQIYEFDRIL